MGRKGRLVVDTNVEELKSRQWRTPTRERLGEGRRRRKKKMTDDGEEKKGDGGGHHHHPQPYYGTFEGVPAYTSQEPVIGFPQPAPPPGAFSSAPHPSYPGYQAAPVAQGRPVTVTVRERRLPCCGIGFGWFLFIIGFFLAAVPWYVGAIIILCSRSVDQREKPGYVACTIAAVIAIIAVIFGVTKGTHAW